MYHQLPGGDSIDVGVHTLTDLVATVFGAPVPAPVVIPHPTPDRPPRRSRALPAAPIMKLTS